MPAKLHKTPVYMPTEYLYKVGFFYAMLQLLVMHKVSCIFVKLTLFSECNLFGENQISENEVETEGYHYLNL